MHRLIITSLKFFFTTIVFIVTYFFASSAFATDCNVGPGKDLTNCDFTGLDFGTVNLSGSKLSGADLTGANLSKTNLSRVSSGGITGTPVGLPLNWRIVQGYLIGPTANLSAANLHGADLDSANLSYANMSNADLSASSLNQANMIGINAVNADFSNGLLYQAVLTDANLSGASLENANLAGSTVSSIDLSGSNLIGLKSSTVQIANRLQGEPKALPKDWFKMQGALIGPSADVSRSSFASPDFKGRNLRNVNFSFTKIDSGNFDNADLRNANFYGASIGIVIVNAGTPSYPTYWVNGPCPTFKGSNLSGANFERSTIGAFDVGTLRRGDWCGSTYPTRGAFSLAKLDDASFADASVDLMDFSDTSFERANFSGTNFNRVLFKNAQASQIIGLPAKLPEDFVIEDGYLLGPEVKLTSVNLSGLDLAGKNLRGANFSFSDFSYKNLNLTNFSSANLTGARIAGASLIGANLSSAQIAGADVTDTDFTSSKLFGLISGGIQGTPLNLPEKWKEVKGYLLGPGANLDSADLSGSNLSGLDLSGTNLKNANLTNIVSGDVQGTPSELPRSWRLIRGYLMGPKANLTGAKLQGLNLQLDLGGAILTNADLSGTQIYNTNLFGVSSGGIKGTPLGLQSGWKVAGGYLVGPGANLLGADLSGLDLRGAQLDSANLRGVNATSSNLSNVTLEHADLTQASLVNADLRYVNLTDANVNDANLSGAALTGIRGGVRGVPSVIPSPWVLVKNYLIGPGANLSYAYLSDANLTSVVSGAITGVPESLPSKWKLLNGYLVGPGANLANANLSYQGLNSMDLSFANLSGANLNDARLDEANLASANLSNTIFNCQTLDGVRSGSIVGVPVSLPRNWKLIGGYLVGPSANLSGANLGSLDLSETSLSMVRSGSITGTPQALPEKWKLISGFLVGPNALFSGVDLTGINFNGADLTGASFYNSNITNANFETAILKDVYSEFFTGNPTALPLGWVISKGTLVGPEARLRGKDFTGADFSNLKLSGADLNGVNFSGAKLSNAILTGTNLSYANFTSAELSGTDLSGSDLSGTNFSNAQISKIKATGLTGLPLNLPPLFQFRNGQLARISGLSPSPLISGFYKTGQELTVATGTWDQDCTKVIKWLRDDLQIDAATNETYRLSSDDFGHRVSAEVSCVAQGYFETPKVSLSKLVETGSFSLSLPTIVGTPKTGQVLSALTDDWGLQPTRTYQWKRNGVPIVAAINLTYILNSADFGKSLSVEVMATQSGFSASFLNSQSVKVGLGEMATSSPVITGSAKVGSVLRISTKTWVSGAKIKYQWLAGGKEIKGATLSNYKVISSQKGKKISVKLTQDAKGYVPRTLTTAAVKIG